MILGSVVGLFAVMIIAIAKILRDDTEPTANNLQTNGEPVSAVVAATTGSLRLELDPFDAKVTIDGNEVLGSGSPRVVPFLVGGTHKLSVSGGVRFLPFEQSVVVTAGQEEALPVRLQAREVMVTVTSEPKGVVIKLAENNLAPKIQGKGSANFKLVREKGSQYKLIGELSGYSPCELPLVFSGNAAETYNLVLNKKKVDTGKSVDTAAPAGTRISTSDLTESSNPDADADAIPANLKNGDLSIRSAVGMPSATVWVDDHKMAKKTPLDIMVTAGSHIVKWRYPDGQIVTKEVFMPSGRAERTIRGTP